VLDEELRAGLADWVRPVAGLPAPDLRVLRRRARRRGLRRTAAAAAITAVLASAAVGITVGVSGSPAPVAPQAAGGPATWAAAPGSWTHGMWQPAGNPPAAGASPLTAPYVVLVNPDGAAQVRDVFTGRVIITAVRPDGQSVAGVAAAGDDRTFVLAGRAAGSVAFDEMRLRQDGRLESLRLLFTLRAKTVPAFAVSADASMLAYSTATGFETVSLAAGTGRTWTAGAGGGGGGGQAFSLSWAGDRTLALEWAPRSLVGGTLPAGVGVRLLDVTAPGSLIQASRLIIPYCASGKVCAEGPLITPDGSRVLATRVTLSNTITTNVEEYSARTGQALAAVTQAARSSGGVFVCEELWTDPSGAMVVSYCGRAEIYAGGHVAPVRLYLPTSVLNARGQLIAW
jgi:hypothetical protein